MYLNTNKLVRLSQQALIDCSWGFGNNGCDGGEDFRVYQWMMKHGGIPTEESYGPYLGQDGFCHLEQASMGLKIKGWVNVTSGDVDALKVRVSILKHSIGLIPLILYSFTLRKVEKLPRNQQTLRRQISLYLIDVIIKLNY